MRPEALERGCCHCISHLAISPGARVGEAGLGAPGWTGLLQFQAESLEIQVLTWVSLGKNEEVVAAGGTSGLERAEFFKSISRQMGPAKANQTSMESVLERGSVGKGGGDSVSATQVRSHQGAGIPEPETYPGLPQSSQRKATPLETVVMAAAGRG